MKQSVHLLIFDIDGTLLLTGGAGKIAFERIFEELFGIKDVWRNAQPHGKTDQIIFREVARAVIQRELTDQELRDLSEGYLDYFQDALEKAGNFRLMPGIPTLIENLNQHAGVFLGVGTGNYKRAADSKLEYARLKQYFHFGGYACDSEVRSKLIGVAIQCGRDKAAEKQLEVDQVFVIGDTPFDVQAGKVNNAITIAVATGSHTVSDLKPHNPDYILEDLSNTAEFYDIIWSY